MSKKPSDSTIQTTFQLKGTMLAITVFEIAHFSIERLTRELINKINEAPEFFETIPMVLGIDKLDVPLTKVELKGLLNLLKEHKVQIMALRSDDPKTVEMAHKYGVVVLPPTSAREKLIEIAINRPLPSTTIELSSADTTTEPQQPLFTDNNTTTTIITDIPTIPDEAIIKESVATVNENNSIEQKTTKVKLEQQPAKIVTTPVRSGQQVEAINGDLIVTANISTGAELIADGNIHIYGAMRGRAMAGYHGNSKARVFCHNLTAELISIAGQIITEEELRRHPLWGKPAQVSLESNQLTITAL